MLDWGLIAILVLGILVGLIAGNANFRKRFFVWFRGFVWGKKGKKQETTIRRVFKQCDACHGLGRVTSPGMRSGNRWERCEICKGTGELEIRE